MEKKDVDIMKEVEEEKIGIIKKCWNETPPHRLAYVYRILADAMKTLGICDIYLSNKQEALDEFKKSVEYYKKALEYADKAEPKFYYVRYYLDFIGGAILTQDEKIIKDVAKHMCDVEDEPLLSKKIMEHATILERLLYHHGFILPNLIMEKHSKTKEHIDFFEKRKKLPSFEYSITDAVKGILEKNPKLIKEGIDKMLKRHVEMLKRKALSGEDKVFCIPAAYILIIARLKGIDTKDIYIESEYIPKVLFEK